LAAGGVITEHRARLLPDNAKKLIFMQYNSNLIKSEYVVEQTANRPMTLNVKNCSLYAS